MERRGYALDGVCAYLLVLLIHMETKYQHQLGHKRLRNVRQVANMFGVHSSRVRDALEVLQRQRLVRWFHDEGYSVNLELFQDLPESNQPGQGGGFFSTQAFHYIADLFVSPKQRKEKVGRMEYLEKLLLLSLVLSADDAGQIRGFDVERFGRWLGIPVVDIRRSLESLRVTYGLVLTYVLSLPLEEGLVHECGAINLNLTHPWLAGQNGFYMYCQMHHALLGVVIEEKRELLRDEKAQREITTEPTCILVLERVLGEGFRASLQTTEYSQWLEICKARLPGLTRKKNGFCFECYGPAVEVSSELPSRLGRYLEAKDVERLLRHWGRTGTSFTTRCNQLYTNSFYICLQLALESMAGREFQALPSAELEEEVVKALDANPLFTKYEGNPEGSLKYHYLEMLHVGALWVMRVLLAEIRRAIGEHPGYSASEPEGLKARFVTYLVDPRLVDVYAHKEIKGKLTGVMLFRIESTSHPRVWGMEIPGEETMKSLFGEVEYSVCMEKDRQWYPVKGYYRHSQEAVSALVGELKKLPASNIPIYNKKSRLIFSGDMNGWADVIAAQSSGER